MSDCSLTPDDLKVIAKASSEGKLPELKHLDLSQNEDLTDQIEGLFRYGQTWTALQSLNMTQKPVSDKDFRDLMKKVKLGCLGSLTELRVSLKATQELKRYCVEMLQLRDFYAICPLGQYFVVMAAFKDNSLLFPNLRKINVIEIKKTSLKTENPLGNKALDMMANASLLQRMPNDLLMNFQKNYDQTSGTLSVDFAEELFEELVPGALRGFLTPTKFRNILSKASQISMGSVMSSKPIDSEQFYDEIVSELFEDDEPGDSFKHLFIENFIPIFQRMHVTRLVHTRKFKVDPALRRYLNSRGTSVYVSPTELSTDIELD